MKGEEIIVSILVTFYNQGKYVDETLGSVMMQQTEYPFEVLCGDDGSSDDTVIKIKEWMQRYPNQIYLYQMDREADVQYEPIIRVSENRKNILSKARGKYILFLDGDDFYTSKYKIQKQVEVLESTDDSVVACGHNANYYWEGGETKRINEGVHSGVMRNVDYWSGLYLHSDTVMFRNVFRDRGVSELSTLTFDDNTIMLYMLRFGNCYYLEENMVNYRQLENSSWNMRTENQKNLLNAMDYYEEIGFAPEMKKYSAARHFYNFQLLLRGRHDGKLLEECREWLDRLHKIRAKRLLNILHYREKSLPQRLWCYLDVTFFILYGKMVSYSLAIKKRLRN